MPSLHLFIPSLTPQNAADLEYGLIVLWEMLENQAPLIEGREADIFAVLLRIRYCGQATVRFSSQKAFLDRYRSHCVLGPGNASYDGLPRRSHI